MKPMLAAVAAILLVGLAGRLRADSPPAANPPLVAQGRHLYQLNCAHCHADDATGDEGPDLHGVKKSDARIAAIIKDGIKGEMPSFQKKLNDYDVKALTAFIRSLNK